MSKKTQKSDKVSEVVREFSKEAKRFDPQGAYVGEDVGEKKKPFQDAEDL